MLNDKPLQGLLGARRRQHWGSSETCMKQLSCFTFCSVYTELKREYIEAGGNTFIPFSYYGVRANITGLIGPITSPGSGPKPLGPLYFAYTWGLAT